MSSKIQENSCPICFTEEAEESPEHIILHCESSCCQDCLVEWLATKIKENYHDDTETQVPCIFSGCKGTLQVQQISSQLTKEHQARVNEELFQAYLNNQQDVRRCPQKNCSYAGIITAKPCSKDLQCELCSTTWGDKIQQTKTHKLLNHLKGFFSVKNEILSQLWKFLFSKKCPHCKSKIIKNGGCDHITCLKCGGEFCWSCPSRYPAHDSTIHKCYPVIMNIIYFIIGLAMLGLLGGFAYLIPPLRFVMDWTVIPVWSGTVFSISWAFGWILWSFSLFRDFFVFNSIWMGLGNAFTPRKHDGVIRAGGLFFGCLSCCLVYYFEIFWPVLRLGCIEFALGYLIVSLRKLKRRFKKKAL